MLFRQASALLSRSVSPAASAALAEPASLVADLAESPAAHPRRFPNQSCALARSSSPAADSAPSSGPRRDAHGTALNCATSVPRLLFVPAAHPRSPDRWLSSWRKRLRRLRYLSHRRPRSGTFRWSNGLSQISSPPPGDGDGSSSPPVSRRPLRSRSATPVRVLAWFSTSTPVRNALPTTRRLGDASLRFPIHRAVVAVAQHGTIQAAPFPSRLVTGLRKRRPARGDDLASRRPRSRDGRLSCGRATARRRDATVPLRRPRARPSPPRDLRTTLIVVDDVFAPPSA